VFEKRMPWKIIGPKKEKVTIGWKKMQLSMFVNG
jgi:hypothetical protein